MGIELNISLSNSCKLLSEKEVNTDLQELSQYLVFNEKNRTLVSIKHCNLFVLNSLKSIISEICNCLIINSNQASITLTNHLFENMLKQILITWDSKGKQFNSYERIDETFKNEVVEYDNKNIELNINKCKSKGLITKDEAERLKFLKNRYRNPFSHASYTKLFEGVKMKVWTGNVNNLMEIKEENIALSTTPPFQLEAQRYFASQNAFPYFIEIYSYIDKMDRKLLDLYPEIKQYLQDHSLI